MISDFVKRIQPTVIKRNPNAIFCRRNAKRFHRDRIYIALTNFPIDETNGERVYNAGKFRIKKKRKKNAERIFAKIATSGRRLLFVGTMTKLVRKT